MKLCIQDPAWAPSEYLLERLLEAAEDATSGAAAFAFASPGGVRLLLEDKTFEKFLARSSFELLVGVDAVTNIAALNGLKVGMDKHPKLTVRVFLNDVRHSLFHPKLCWFRSPQRTVCLVGSGNLTTGGLRGNREAFTLSRIESGKTDHFDETWSSWIAFHQQRLLPPDNANVLRRARLNRGTELPPNWKNDALVEDKQGRISVGLPKHDSDLALIAEIPRSGDRWNQANFDLDTFQNYFGATPGQTQRIILTHVSDEGEIGPEEVRPSVAVSSHNFRFELEAASGRSYPRDGRPIVIFVRVATRTFRYRLLMPKDSSYNSAVTYLDENHHSSRRGLRRLVTTVGSLRREHFFSGLATGTTR